MVCVTGEALEFVFFYRLVFVALPVNKNMKPGYTKPMVGEVVVRVRGGSLLENLDGFQKTLRIPGLVGCMELLHAFLKEITILLARCEGRYQKKHNAKSSKAGSRHE
jgi:hypothetical protein